MNKRFLQSLYLFVGILLSFSVQSNAQQKLVISPEMVYNLSARGDAWILFDNQNIPNGTYNCDIPQTNNIWAYYDASWNGRTFFYPVDVVVDLGTQKTITQICVDDASDAGGIITVSRSNNPTSWNDLFTHTNTDSDCHSTSTSARYIKFSFNSTMARGREISIYSNSGNNPTCPPASTGCDVTDNCFCPRLPMDEFIGANFNIDVPAEKANCVGFVRAYQHEYFNWGHGISDYEGYPEGGYMWAPVSNPPATLANPPIFNHDVLYEQLSDMDIGVNAAMHHAQPGLVTWAYHNGDLGYNATDAFFGGDYGEGGYFASIQRKPIDESLYPIWLDKQFDDPAMYLEYSDIFYQFGARFGFPGNNQNLKVGPGNVARSGMDVVEYVENWNEQDKWWTYFQLESYPWLNPWIEEEMAYFSPAEFAAMSSAQYDGHGETNGIENIVTDRYGNNIPNGASPVGLANSNSGMKFVMGGLSEINLEYVRAMKFWFDHHRPDIGFPFDVINFHEYFNDGQNGAPLGNNAVSPEDDDIRGQIEEVVEFRDRYLPGVEIWLSEFGYDSNPNSPQSANCASMCGDCNSAACYDKFETIQAQWNVRSFLEIAAGGADRAMVFNMRDEAPETTWSLYATSGLTKWNTDNFDGYQNKPAWYYISTMTKALEGMKYDPSFVHNNSNVRMYKFTEDCSNGKTIFAVWSPTSTYGDNTTIYSNYSIPFNNGIAPTIVSMQDGDVDGVRSAAQNIGGTYRVNVSETPRFVVFDNMPDEDFANCDCNKLSYTVSGGGTNTNGVRNEQNNIGEPYCGEGFDMYSAWQPNINQQVTLDLGTNYNLTNLFIYSTGLVHGDVQISYGSPQTGFTLYDTYDAFTTRPHKWRTFTEVGIQTRYVRIRVLDSNMSIGEVVICGTPSGNVTPTCSDGILNQGEAGVDCGGPCPACASCFDGVQNQGETGVDCGGPCAPCTTASCFDGIQNQGETGVDCGGPCTPCSTGGCDVAISSSNGTVTITGLTNQENAKLFDTSISSVWGCNPWNGNACSATETVTGLTVGATYFLSVQSNDCDLWIPIVVQSGGGGASCTDGIQNGNETGVDCGGNCPSCPSCFDGIQNQGEAGIDCGGPCVPCVTASCFDGIQNQGETGVDCGGPCTPCNTGGCNVNMTSANGSVTITGLTNQENAKIFDSSIATVWGCNPWNGNACSGTETVTGLTVGATYFLSVQSDVCDLWIPITVQGGGGGATCFDGIQNQGETGVDCGGPCAPCNTGSCEIALTPQMFYRIDGSSAAASSFGGALADEQNAMGDPINGNGSDVLTAWQYPWSDGVQTYLDLGQNYTINGIYLFDGFGGGTFEVSPGLPSQNQAAVVSFSADVWPPQWRNFEGLNFTTRYLTFTRVDGGALMNEVAICGTPSTQNLGGSGDNGSWDLAEQKANQKSCEAVLFPNPVERNLNIATKGEAIYHIKIVDLNGVVRMEYDLPEGVLTEEVDISKLNNGVYFLYLKGGEDCAPSFNRFVKMDRK